MDFLRLMVKNIIRTMYNSNKSLDLEVIWEGLSHHLQFKIMNNSIINIQVDHHLSKTISWWTNLKIIHNHKAIRQMASHNLICKMVIIHTILHYNILIMIIMAILIAIWEIKVNNNDLNIDLIDYINEVYGYIFESV